MFRLHQESLRELHALLTLRRTRGVRRGGRMRGRCAQLRWRRAPRSLLPIVAVALCAACSDDTGPGAESTIEVATPAAEATSTTQLVSATSTAPIVTTTEPPAPTTEAAPDPELAVRAAVDIAQESFSACLVAMPACDPASLSVARAGDLLARNSARIEEWNALGYTVRDRESFRYVIEAVELDGAGAAAIATVCIADGSRLVQPHAAPDGSDVIVDDEFVSGRSTWDMRLDADGVWRAFDTAPLGETSSEDVCGAG